MLLSLVALLISLVALLLWLGDCLSQTILWRNFFDRWWTCLDYSWILCLGYGRHLPVDHPDF